MARSRFSHLFTPRDQEYFDLFEEAGRNAARTTTLLCQMLADYPATSHLFEEIRSCEHDGDRIVHDIMHRLNNTFVTPIDREDILALAKALDDIVDYTDEVADYMGLYKVQRPMREAVSLAKVLNEACGQIAEAIPRLRDFRDISHYTVEVNRLENEGDRITREAVASLFDDATDPMVVVRWKDLLERLEAAVDSTETAANILETIVIKNS